MAITQNSIIKHRRGLLVNIPTELEDSELGHAVDDRRLFIGNGTIADGAPEVGNTEIITEFTPLTIQNHTYVSNTAVNAITGPTANDPIVRSLQARLDDHLSIKSYGAIGDGIADDVIPINRALENIYAIEDPTDPVQGYRVIFFPAGTYNISDQIFLPPNTILIGEGIGRTKIVMTDNTKTSMVRTADSLFQQDLQIGTGLGAFPENIKVFGIEFEHIGDKDIVLLERASNVTFEECAFTTGWDGSSPSLSEAIVLDPIGGIFVHNRITLVSCLFDNVPNIMSTAIANTPSNIVFESCTFLNGITGITADIGLEDMRISNCLFETFEDEAIIADANNVVSSHNMFKDVGTVSLQAVLFDVNAVACTSTSNSFSLQPNVVKIVDNGDSSLILNAQTDFHFGNIIQTPKQELLGLSANVTNANVGIQFDTSLSDTIIIEYTIKRDVGGDKFRVGEIKIVADGLNGSSSPISNEFTENGAINVTFDAEILSGILNIVYTADIGNAFDMVFSIKHWKSF